MTLSVLCATRAEACVRPFLAEMGSLARSCGGRFGVVLDGVASYGRWKTLDLSADLLIASDGVHRGMQDLVDVSQSDYIFILDDDERCTPALARWLTAGLYTAAEFWRVPRAWLFGDTRHYLSSPKHWPNHDMRIGRRDRITVPTGPMHAGWIRDAKTAAVTPYAIEHHKFLIRTLDERLAEVEARERVQSGAGMYKQYLPEKLMVDVAEWAG